ncbi:recombinase family protein [Phenylobacterium sp.]|uniref:recombinase family protein n=1 Tax=Phenylobacterium sp. TaxID=1871053 RepID=UPI0035209FE5
MANRPGLLDAISAAERGEYDVLLAEDEDRIARSLEHLAHVVNRLQDAGAQLATPSSGMVQTMHVAMKGLIAEDFLRNLSAKTKRGMNANAERGLATGSRLFGYVSEPGGGMTIIEAEADIIRRIYAAYAAGDTAREIASALNSDGVPSPRGGLWNASSVGGSRQRGNGILNTELYRGVKVWNRMEVRKDRTTGKRTPRMRPEAEWKRTDVPHLRIVDEETWRAVRARRDQGSLHPGMAQRRPGLFSGLLKCGVCGGTYTVYTTGKLVCATYREKGTCTNRRTPQRSAVEAAALAGLRDQLLSPEAVARYVRSYHHAARARRSDLTSRKTPLERRLAEARRGAGRIVSAIERGIANLAMEARLMELEGEAQGIEAQLAQLADEQPPFELHPRAAEAYAAVVSQLEDTLRDSVAGETPAQRRLVDEIRGLIERIDIVPLTQERGGPMDLVIHGALSRFAGGLEHHGNPGLGAVVAGGGLEPPTCGL